MSTLNLTAQIVANFVSNNPLSRDDLPKLIADIHRAIEAAGAPSEPEAPKVEPLSAAAIRKSITPDKLISFIDGKGYATLKRHLFSNGLTVADYKTRYGLPDDYPMTSPNYSLRRSAMAKDHGLGKRAAPKSAAPKSAAPPKSRTPKKTKA